MYSRYRKSVLRTVPGSSFSSSSVLPSSMSKSVPKTLLSPLFRGTTRNKEKKHQDLFVETTQLRWLTAQKINDTGFNRAQSHNNPTFNVCSCLELVIVWNIQIEHIWTVSEWCPWAIPNRKGFFCCCCFWKTLWWMVHFSWCITSEHKCFALFRRLFIEGKWIISLRWHQQKG